MKKILVLVIVLLIASAAVFLWPKTIEKKQINTSPTSGSDQGVNDIGRNKALEIALKANPNNNRTRTLPITTEEKAGQYIVTFPIDPPLPPGVEGGDFALKIFIDKKTGDIIGKQISD